MRDGPVAGEGYVRAVAVALVAVRVCVRLRPLPQLGLLVENRQLRRLGLSQRRPANSRDAKRTIKSSNVNELQTAWTLPIKGQSSFGSYASSPIVSKGVDLLRRTSPPTCRRSNADSGDVLWTKSYEQPSLGPNGLVVQNGRCSARPGSRSSRSTRKPASSSGRPSSCATKSRESTSRRAMTRASSTPRRCRPTWPRSTNPAASASSGRWTRRAARNSGTSTRCPKSLWGHPEINSGGGVWYTPAFDGKGSMYFGVGNPAPFPGTRRTSVGIEQARPEPLHRLDREARREDGQDGVVLPAQLPTTSTTGTCRARRS